jgi:hypothetical protein
MKSCLAKPISIKELLLDVRPMASANFEARMMLWMNFTHFFGILLGNFFQDDRGNN